MFGLEVSRTNARKVPPQSRCKTSLGNLQWKSLLIFLHILLFEKMSIRNFVCRESDPFFPILLRYELISEVIFSKQIVREYYMNCRTEQGIPVCPQHLREKLAFVGKVKIFLLASLCLEKTKRLRCSRRFSWSCCFVDWFACHSMTWHPYVFGNENLVCNCPRHLDQERGSVLQGFEAKRSTT